ncbi:ASPIC/UnbV domain-containing protein [Candidatus Thiomargarita nelsonii]|uniref:ASPIC/UnbV domain-containing protein n=1 Tax=Candidatus Thiomargarita nelsonii TaxID=1003181 RepID=A0A176RUI8_9GAMM|nr:ASPIC/UnbV domain-containing protein [Candidatus Thiomargarita nelsonii]
MGLEAGVVKPIKSFSTWFWDYNNDGWLDIFVGSYGYFKGEITEWVIADYLGILPKEADAHYPRLYQNNQDGTFTDVTLKAKLDKIMFPMGANFGDLDNDGYLDFYLGTGEPNFRALMPNRSQF